MQVREEVRRLQAKYDITAWFYDILDFPWELQYRRWRPGLLEDVRGCVLEAGVGTGRNLPYYDSAVSLTGIDLSRAMLRRAAKRGRRAVCQFQLCHEDVTTMESIPSGHFDWVISTFLCCVLPDPLQPLALEQFERILKPGGRFRLLEIIYSKEPRLRRRQEFLAPFVARAYGARFDRNTLEYVRRAAKLTLLGTRFLKHDTYLVIEGKRTE
jgi:demethylmenaquinone methyltransferase/2-methoxy-6-polyprenyl-1,4-benzoquinol methylase